MLRFSLSDIVIGLQSINLIQPTGFIRFGEFTNSFGSAIALEPMFRELTNTYGMSPAFSPLFREMVSAVGVSPFWTPAETTTAIWYDAADTDTITLNGSTVSQWDDKSTNDRHATQGATVKQPTVSTINGLPALSFDGADDILETPLTQLTTGAIFLLVCPTGKGVSANNVVMGAATAFNLGGLFYNLTTFADGSSKHRPFYTTEVATANKYYDGQNTTQPTVYKCSIYMHQFSGVSTESLVYALGGKNTTAALANENYLGTMGEVIILPTAPSDAERQRIEGYLAWKWGMVADLPLAHPYKLTPPLSTLF